MNWYPETIESNEGKTVTALYSTPGLSLFVTLPDTPVRGQILAGGRSFAVGGSIFCETTGAAITNQNVIATDGKPVSMVGGTSQILIASAGAAYVFNFSTNTFTSIPSAILTGIIKVGYIDGFFLALFIGSNGVSVLQASALLDATTWPPLSIDTENAFADTLSSMIVDHQQVWTFGMQRSLAYYDAGNFPFPLATIPGGVMEQGISAPNSVVQLDNSIFWIGGDSRGTGIGWRANGVTPTRISNHAIETAWQGYSTISDAVAYSYQDQGHSFWVIYFPTANHTWVYDVATGQWHERGYWSATNGIFTAHRSQNHIFANGQHLVGDWASGKIYIMSIANYTDRDNLIRRVRRAPHISTENEWIQHHRLQIDMETGLGPTPPLTDGLGNPRDPEINLRWSDDGGHVWSNIHTLGVGKVGNYLKRVIFRRLGRSRDRVYEVSCSDPIPFRLLEADLLASPGFQPSERIVKQYQKVG